MVKHRRHRLKISYTDPIKKGQMRWNIFDIRVAADFFKVKKFIFVVVGVIAWILQGCIRAMSRIIEVMGMNDKKLEQIG